MAKFELKGKYTDGTDWTAGTFDVPTSLPNYMSLKKPTKVDVSTDGSEVTYSGVAEFESGGAMESGEFHDVKESPLVFMQVGTTTNAVVGGTVLMVNSWFNRTPHLNEKCYFITTQPDRTKVAWTGKCIQIDGDSCRFQVFLVTQLGGGVKKYLHSITMKTNGAFAICLHLVTTQSSDYTIDDIIAMSFNKIYPASGMALIGTGFKTVVNITTVLNQLYARTFDGSDDAYGPITTASIFVDVVTPL